MTTTQTPAATVAPKEAAKPTPENTPVPGGGRWSWGGAGWVEVVEASSPTNQTSATNAIKATNTNPLE